MPDINTDKVCFVIVKARQVDLAEGEPVLDGSNETDDQFSSAYAESGRLSPLAEAQAFVRSMNEDEQCELEARCWVGREDFLPEEWDAAVAEARSRREQPTSDYLLGMPLLADYLEEGLAKFGLDCRGFEDQRL